MNARTRKQWFRVSSVAVGMAMLFGMPGLGLAPTFADSVVVTGTVTSFSGVPLEGVSCELHTPDGHFMHNDVPTNASGVYSFSDVLTAGTNYVVECRIPDGYNHYGVNPDDSNFVYRTGDATRTVNFTMIAASKTISGQVTDTNGQVISDAVVYFTPYNVSGASSQVTARTDETGHYSGAVVGGTWFVQPVADLHTYTQRWISEVPPSKVVFAVNEASETTAQNFQVTPATGQVSVTLHDSDGSTLTSQDFAADVSFRRADGVGTIRKVRDTDTPMTVFLTPGIYTISVYHRTMTGKSFDPAKTTFVMTENGNVDLGTVQAVVNSAHLKGKVKSTEGSGMANVRLEAQRVGGSERVQGNTTTGGSYELVVGAGTWTVGLAAEDESHIQIAPATATVINGQTASDMTITIKNMDRTITGKIITLGGSTITDYIGSVYARTADDKAKVSTPVVNGSYSLRYSSSDIPGPQVILGVEAGNGSAYTGSVETKITMNKNTGTKNLTVKLYNALLSGTLVYPNGSAVQNSGSPITVEAVDELGNFTTATVAADGTYSLHLAAGTWLYDYAIADETLTPGLLNKPVGSNSVTIKAGQTLAGRNLVVNQGTNTISGTITDANGVTVKSAPVLIDNRQSVEANAATKSNTIVSLTVQTDANGHYSAKVPNGTYLVSVGDTPSIAANQLPPDGKTVTVKSQQSTTVNEHFDATNATITGSVTYNKKTDGGGSVSAYTDNGKETKTTVGKNGKYTLNVTSGDKWHVVVNDLSGKKLVASETADLTPKAGKNSKNLNMTDSGIVVPGPVTKSFGADESGNVSLPDGTSVSVPPFAIGLTGDVSLTVTPSVTLDKTTADAPATLTYEVKATDSAGYDVKLLNKPAEITIPYSATTTASNGLSENRLHPTYYNPQTGTWQDSGMSGLVNTKANEAVIRTNHLSKFSVSGMPKKAPKITAVKVKSSTAKTLVVEVTGSNFTGTPTATIGSVKASKVVVNSSQKLTITFPATSLKSASYKLTLTLKNGRTITKSITATRRGQAVSLSSWGLKVIAVTAVK